MINIKLSGSYKLIETKNNTKILYLDKRTYAWVEPKEIGEILVVSHNVHKTDCLLAQGKYRLYDVVNEPFLSDQLHLELEVGKNKWQGYLLLSGLPSDIKKRGRIIPTHEVITNNLIEKINEEKPIKHVVTSYDAEKLGKDIGINFKSIDFDQFKAGLAVEMEHGAIDPQTNVTNDDPDLTAKIAWAHLKEMPDYYTKLAKMENENN